MQFGKAFAVAGAVAGSFFGLGLFLGNVLNKAVSNTKISNTDISNMIATMRPSDMETPNDISDTDTSDLKTPKAISNTETSDTKTPKAISSTDTSHTKTPKATSNTDTSDTKTPKAISNTDTSDTKTPKAISNTDTSDTKTPKAISNTDTSDTKILKTISNTDTSDTKTPKAISNTDTSHTKTPKAISNTDTSDTKTPKAISNTDTSNAISDTKTSNAITNTKTFNSSQKGEVIVQLFEWRWDDIATECSFLPEYGYTAIQTSPVTENAILTDRPWSERYQPVSYKMTTRSGNEEDFRKMVQTCNENHIKVYVDVVLNHMSSSLSEGTLGTAGSRPDTQEKIYPDVPYGPADFHKSCQIVNWNDASEVRNCELNGRHDLNQASDNVRGKIVNFLNKLIDIGVAGFRVSDARHIAVEDLAAIYSRVKDLNTTYFPAKSRPYIYQEVSDNPPSREVRPDDYLQIGSVEDFKMGFDLSQAFCRRITTSLELFKNYSTILGQIKRTNAVVFVDNHDYQRNEQLSYYKKRNSKLYKIAVAFLLAWPHSEVRIMSSYEYFLFQEGPPSDGPDKQIRRVTRKPDGSCSGGWICEHRWRLVSSMVLFRNTVYGSEVSNWTEIGKFQFAFCRKGKGFVAFNLDKVKPIFAKQVQTCLPSGLYCDVISGSKTKKNTCTGKHVKVGPDGQADVISILKDDDGILAIHIEAKLN